MKKIFLALAALVGTMSMNAQVMKVYKGGEVVYTGAQADSVVFSEAPVATITGTAKATIDGQEVDVKWVQLWEGGPKFAEKNVGATKITDKGTAMKLAEAAKTGDDYVWGANWYTPSKEEFDELLKAATTSGSTKVKCEKKQVDGVWVYEFTGKESAYTENSVYFPIQTVDRDNTYANYWAGTVFNKYYGWCMGLYYENSKWISKWDSNDGRYFDYRVRPAFKEN